MNSSYPITPQGRLWINVVEARNLLPKSNYSRPYCVVEFEKNEFVTREATFMSLSHPQSHINTPSQYASLSPNGNDFGFETFMAQDTGLHPLWKHEAAL